MSTNPVIVRSQSVPWTAGSLLAAGLALVLFSNAVQYGLMFHGWRIQLEHVVALIGAAAVPFLLLRSGRILETPIFAWTALFVLLCLAYFVVGGGADADILAARLIAPVLLILAYSLFTQSDQAMRVVPIVIACCVVAGTAINLFDIANPFVLIPATSELALPGRASGLYMNPNQAGAALVLGMAVAVAAMRPAIRPWYVLIACFGVALTVSRSAAAGCALVLCTLALTRVLRVRDLLLIVGLIAMSAWAVWEFVLPELGEEIAVDLESLARRLIWFLDTGVVDDFSREEREYLTERGWAQYVASPLFGNGLGSTETWSERGSTHNLYVMLMSDFGALGALVLPALVFAATWGARGAERAPIAAIGVFVLFWGFFSHNVLSEPFTLVALAYAAALRDRSLDVIRSVTVDVTR